MNFLELEKCGAWKNNSCSYRWDCHAKIQNPDEKKVAGPHGCYVEGSLKKYHEMYERKSKILS